MSTTITTGDPRDTHRQAQIDPLLFQDLIGQPVTDTSIGTARDTLLRAARETLPLSASTRLAGLLTSISPWETSFDIPGNNSTFTTSSPTSIERQPPMTWINYEAIGRIDQRETVVRSPIPPYPVIDLKVDSRGRKVYDLNYCTGETYRPFLERYRASFANDERGSVESYMEVPDPFGADNNMIYCFRNPVLRQIWLEYTIGHSAITKLTAPPATPPSPETFYKVALVDSTTNTVETLIDIDDAKQLFDEGDPAEIGISLRPVILKGFFDKKSLDEQIQKLKETVGQSSVEVITEFHEQHTENGTVAVPRERARETRG